MTGPKPKAPVHERVLDKMREVVSSPEFQSYLQAGSAPDYAELTRQVADGIMQEDAVESGDIADPNQSALGRAAGGVGDFYKSVARGATAPLEQIESGFNKFAGHFAPGTNVHGIKDARQAMEPRVRGGVDDYVRFPFTDIDIPTNPMDFGNAAAETGAEFESVGQVLRPFTAGARMAGLGKAGSALANAAGRRGLPEAGQAIMREIPTQVGGNLAYQGATDPQSLTTPEGMIQGVGFGVLGALGAAKGMRGDPTLWGQPATSTNFDATAGIPRGVIPMGQQPQGPSMRDIMLQPRSPRPQPDPIGEIVQQRQQVSAMQPDPNPPNIDQNRVLQQVFGTAPNLQQTTSSLAQPPARVVPPQLRPLDPFSRDVMDMRKLNPTAGTPFADDALSVMQEAQRPYSPPPSRPMEPPMPETSSDRMKAEIARLRAENAAMRGDGAPQGPASPPRTGEIGWPEATPELVARRGMPQPDKPFEQLYPDTPPVKPMTPTEPSGASAASAARAVSPSEDLLYNGLEAPASEAPSGPGRTFMGQTEFVRAVKRAGPDPAKGYAAKGTASEEWVPNEAYAQRVKLAQEAGTYDKLVAAEAQAAGGGPAEGEPFRKPAVKRKRKPKLTPKDPASGTGEPQ